MTEDYDEGLAQDWYEKKTVMMVRLLGKEHDRVMHAIIPYAIGRGLDLYYFPHGTGYGHRHQRTLRAARRRALQPRVRDL